MLKPQQYRVTTVSTVWESWGHISIVHGTDINFPSMENTVDVWLGTIPVHFSGHFKALIAIS
jgi:hypothetical protein